jgi:carbonic anhydrase
MLDLNRLFENNRRWAAHATAGEPNYFHDLARGQEPHFLAIGCSDSRVPLELLTGANPGEMFVHRNVANQVFAADLNVLSVLQYAIEALHVKHVLVVGHYGCGGVLAAMEETQRLGLVDNWLGDVRDVKRRHHAELATLESADARYDRLVELNVLHQVLNLARTPVVQTAWDLGRHQKLHGAVFDVRDGLLRSLVAEVDDNEKADGLIPMA